jgi:hypothetical protein
MARAMPIAARAARARKVIDSAWAEAWRKAARAAAGRA